MATIRIPDDKVESALDLIPGAIRLIGVESGKTDFQLTTIADKSDNPFCTKRTVTGFDFTLQVRGNKAYIERAHRFLAGMYKTWQSMQEGE